MTEPSQSREQLRRAIQTISSRPPPSNNIAKTIDRTSYPELPELESAKIKNSYGTILFITLVVIGFLTTIFFTIALRFN